MADWVPGNLNKNLVDAFRRGVLKDSKKWFVKAVERRAYALYTRGWGARRFSIEFLNEEA